MIRLLHKVNVEKRGRAFYAKQPHSSKKKPHTFFYTANKKVQQYNNRLKKHIK